MCNWHVMLRKDEYTNFSLDGRRVVWYNLYCWFVQGEMAEWLKALVLKTSDVARHRGFESLSLRHQAKWRSTQEAEGAPLLRE